MRIMIEDAYDADWPRIQLELRDLLVGEQWYLAIGPVKAEMTVDVLRHLQTEVTAALMEAQHSEDSYRDMLNGEKEASEAELPDPWGGHDEDAPF